MDTDPTEWATHEIDRFLDVARRYDRLPFSGEDKAVLRAEALGMQSVVVRILDRYDPGWRDRLQPRPVSAQEWEPIRHVAMQAREVIARQHEIDQMLGPAGLP